MKIKWVSMAAAAVIFLSFVLLLFFSHRQDIFTTRTMIPYNTGWTYCYGEESGTATLPDRLDVPKDTEVVLKNRLPEDLRDDFGIVFRTRMQYVRVYVENRLVYQFPEQELIGGKITSAWNFVRLSEADSGKEVRICLISPYSRFSGSIGAVRYGAYDNLVTGMISAHVKNFRLSFLIGIMGVIMLLVSLISRRHRLFGWQGNFGILLMMAAFWLAGESRLPSGIIGLEAWHYFSLAALLFCPAFLMAYLHVRWREICGRVTAALFLAFLAAGGAGILSEAAGGPDLIEVLPAIQLMAGAALVYTLVLYILAARKKKERFIRSELACILAITLAGIGEIVRFYRTDQMVGTFLRLAILLYALDILGISIRMIYRKMQENQELEERLKRSRAELMASQIRPHFIYNTLNSIRALIRVDPETAMRTVNDFSTYLRSNLDHVVDREMIPFSDELRHIQAYLNIEQVRFEERLQVEMDIRAKSFRVPPLSIQPLVENAVKHGICRKMSGGTVTVRSYEEKDACVVEVLDDGVGFDVSAAESPENEDGLGHVGLKNICFRVQEIAGGSLSVESQPGVGTKVTVYFRKPGTGQRGKKRGGGTDEDHGRG